MPAPDLQGPYDEFVERLGDIRKIVGTVESCYRQPGVLATTRPDIDLNAVGPTTSNSANSMSLVFLASSYEEFVREEISECARLLSSKYDSMSDRVRHTVRSSYWKTTLQRLNYTKGILTKTEPKTPDVATLARIRPIIEVAQLFVINDDPTRIDPATTVHHSNNFRPRVVDEIAARIGIEKLTRKVANGARVRAYFGVTSASASASKLAPKLDEFYDRRNEIVHSLSSTSGYGVDYVLDWLSFFDIVAESTKIALGQTISNW